MHVGFDGVDGFRRSLDATAAACEDKVGAITSGYQRIVEDGVVGNGIRGPLGAHVSIDPVENPRAQIIHGVGQRASPCETMKPAPPVSDCIPDLYGPAVAGHRAVSSQSIAARPAPVAILRSAAMCGWQEKSATQPGGVGSGSSEIRRTPAPRCLVRARRTAHSSIIRAGGVMMRAGASAASSCASGRGCSIERTCRAISAAPTAR